MKITFKTLMESLEALNELRNQNLGIYAAYILSKNQSLINKEAEFYDKKRIEFCEKYGTLEGKSYVITDTENFKKEITDLLNLEIDLDIKKISISDLKEAKISAAKFELIKYLILDEL